jgi:hypothetical protein
MAVAPEDPAGRRIWIVLLLAPLLLCHGVQRIAADEHRIQPYPANPYFWQYQGQPLLLLGGTDDDNLFQWDESALRTHLNQLRAVGGNFVRNTMSSRDEGNVQPFARAADGRYDLDSWNPEYWERFERFLRCTGERDIIVQIEFWDPWDTYADAWGQNPWNPSNNVSYTTGTTRLTTTYSAPQYRDGTSQGRPHDFFLTPPQLHDDRIVLAHQHRFVEEILVRSLPHPHVLYCVSNEIHPQYPPEWGWYWAHFIRQRATAANRQVFLTEMFWTFDFQAAQHRASFDRHDLYDFFEASQNSAVRDPETHWRNLQFARQRLASQPRPINHTKTYGADTGPVWAGTDRDALERFWRNVIGGAASSRFHRPPAGIGLSDAAQRHLRSARLLGQTFDLFRAIPDEGHRLMSNRASNEAYLAFIEGEQYAVYFPDGGDISLDLGAMARPGMLRWLNISESLWSGAEQIAGGSRIQLQPPGQGHWVALLEW